MDKLDELIRERLAGEDQEIYEKTGPLGWFALSRSQFRGTLGWVTWLIVLVQAVLFFSGVYCTIMFFAASEVLLALKWGLSGAVLLLSGLILKLSLMPQMQADRVIRELKRLKLMRVL